MLQKTILAGVGAGWLCAIVASPVSAQPSGAALGPASQPTGPGNLVYEVVEVQRRVRVAPIGEDPVTGTRWRQVKRGDHLKAGDQIHTGLRSKLKLVARPANPPTVILIENATLMNISELQQLPGTSRSRIELGYGAIRAGVAEGEVRSDMQISSPAAVLSKRGTDIFRVEYMNGRFRMSLSDQGRGMLEAMQLEWSVQGRLVRTRNRFVAPGQFVNQRMLQAIENVVFDRDVSVNDLFGLQGNDKLFAMMNDRGIGFLFQGFNAGVNTSSTDEVTTLADGEEDGGDGLLISAIQPGPDRNQGNFGIGQGIIPNLFNGLGRRRLHDMRQRECSGADPRTCKQRLSRRIGRRRR